MQRRRESAFAESFLRKKLAEAPVLDQDRIQKDLGCSQGDAGKLVIQSMDGCIKNKESFIFETTLTSRNFEHKLVERAKENAFDSSFIISV